MGALTSPHLHGSILSNDCQCHRAPWTPHAPSCRLLRIHLVPLLGLLFCFYPVLYEVVGHAGVEGIARLRRAQQGLDTEEHRADLEGRAPLVLQHIEANAAKLVYVRVVDLREEPDLW